MKTLLLFLLLFPMMSFGQSPQVSTEFWLSDQFGNSFDGFNLSAYVMNNEDNFLCLRNNSNNILLDCNGESFGDDGENYLQNNVDVFVTNSFKPSSVLISFDNENEYYKTVFGTSYLSDDNSYQIYITELISKDYSKIYLKNFFIDKLKQHSKINLRLSNETIKKDISFTLKGSTGALNKTVKYSNNCMGDDASMVGVVRNALTLALVFNETLFKNKPYYFDFEDIREKITSNLGLFHPWAHQYSYYKYLDAPTHIISFFNEDDENVGEFKYVFPQKYDSQDNALKFGFSIFQSATEEEINYEEYIDLINSVSGSDFLYDQFVHQGYRKSQEEFIKLLNISIKE
ncbi:MAG: hypothetical protein QNK85_09630 [Crocinitomicaceae bacterium]